MMHKYSVSSFAESMTFPIIISESQSEVILSQSHNRQAMSQLQQLLDYQSQFVSSHNLAMSILNFLTATVSHTLTNCICCSQQLLLKAEDLQHFLFCLIASRKTNDFHFVRVGLVVQVGRGWVQTGCCSGPNFCSFYFK